MRLRHVSLLITSLLISYMLTSCVEAPAVSQTNTPTPFQPQDAMDLVDAEALVKLYLSESTPQEWVEEIQKYPNIEIVDNEEAATLKLVTGTENAGTNTLATFDLVFAAAVPFFTTDDETDVGTLKNLWTDPSSEDENRIILVTDKSNSLLSAIWGEPGKKVITGEASELLSMAEATPTSIAIIPFEEISPLWKILKINGVSPLDKPFEQEKYPLTVTFSLVTELEDQPEIIALAENIKELIPSTNRDESKMTVLVMTGTTAITRGVAYKVTINDAEYPIAFVKDWFLDADLRHLSNESPFVEDCPPPDPYSSSLVFCSSPAMLKVLENIGVNIVELSGNHIKDYLEENLLYTFDLYEERGMTYYAAGRNAEAAREPVLMEHNGNKIAFIGCNAVGPSSVWAREDRAGAAECDLDYLTRTIADLKERGYVVVTTFQHEELAKQDGAAPVYMFAEKISGDFQKVAEAGASIVQGSQAHYPMGIEFVGDSLIHYGLGNFLFDQMWYPNRYEFIDRHIIYDGKYINTELLTAVLMDWSQPTPMGQEERQQFLEDIFNASEKRSQ